MALVTVKTTGDGEADITIRIDANSTDFLPLQLDLNLRNKLRAMWLIFTGRQLRISGPLEWNIHGKVA